MRLKTVLLLVLMAFVLIGCRNQTAESPTPFATSGGALTPASGGPVVLSVTELMNAPGLYVDTVVQVSGLLRKQPLVVCDAELFPSPAGWGLAEEGMLALAGGLDEQVRSLLPEDLLMTVEGRWRRWEGTVGCGKEAQQQEVWYLEASRILSPSPLTQVTLTPSSGGALAEVTADPNLGGAQGTTAAGGETLPEQSPTGALATVAPTTESPIAGQTLTPTDEFTGTAPIETTVAPGTPAAGTTPQATLAGAATQPATGEATAAATPGGTTAATVTADATTIATSPTATTAAGTGTGDVVQRGNLYEVMEADYIIANLAGGTTDSWEVDIFEDEELYVMVVAPTPADIILSLLKDGQPIVNRQNTSPAGSPEVINNPALQGEGLYEIQVLTNGGTSTDYALAFYTDPEFVIEIPGMIAPGVPRSAVQMPTFALHYWFFAATAGQTYTITLTPLGNEDPALYLNGPDLEEIDWVDNGFEGEEEVIEFTASSTGLHAIGVEELYGDPLNYNLNLTSN